MGTNNYDTLCHCVTLTGQQAEHEVFPREGMEERRSNHLYVRLIAITGIASFLAMTFYI